jgi:hypothetical protein
VFAETEYPVDRVAGDQSPRQLRVAANVNSQQRTTRRSRAVLNSAGGRWDAADVSTTQVRLEEVE